MQSSVRWASSAALLFLLIAGSAPPAAGQTGSAAKGTESLGDLLQQKVTAAAKYEQTVVDAAASVTIVTSQEIEELGFETLAELLASVRSFYISYDRNYDYAGVRGFSRPTDYNDRILLLIDGHTLNENTYGMAPLGTDFAIPFSAVDRVEIIRGPGAALYGTYAMLAVVNVITRQGRALDGVHASAEVGSFGRKGGSLAWGRAFASGLDLLVAARYLDVDGQDLFYPEYADGGDGFARGQDGDRAFGLLLSARIGQTSVRGGMTWREKDVPTGAYGTTFADPRFFTRDQRQWIDVSHEHAIAFDKSLSVRLFADRYYYEGGYPFEALYTDESLGTWAGAETRFRWDLSSKHRLIVGAEYRYNFRSTYDYLDEAGQILSDHDVHSSVFSLYAQDELAVLPRLSLTLGLRYDRYSTEGSAASPRAGLVYRFSADGAVKLLYGEAFRAANTYEQTHPDTADGARLDAERIRTLQLEVSEKLTPWLHGSASAYRYQMRDLIDAVSGGDGSVLYRNQGGATAHGVELELNARFASRLRASTSYTLQSARDENDQLLTNSPRHVLKSALVLDLPGNVTTGVRFRCESGRITVYRTETGSSCLTDLNVVARPISQLTLTLTLRNLFDRDYATPGGFEHRQPAIPQDGRSILGRASFGF